MFQRRPKRFRRRVNDRGGMPHNNGHLQKNTRSNSFSNGHSRNKFRVQQSAEKLYEKYSSLAKEAMSSGDKTLSENYLQHADHYMRIIEDKNKNQIQSNSSNITEKENNNLSQIKESEKENISKKE